MIDYSTFLNVDNLQLAKELRANFNQIKIEAHAFLGSFELANKPKAYSSGQFGRNPEAVNKPMIEGDVKSAYLWVRKELLDDGELEIVSLPEVAKSRAWRRTQNPTLMNLMYPKLHVLGNVGFNKLGPGARINPHFGMSTDYFRLHLGIITDPKAFFFLEGHAPYSWKTGELMAFADGDVKHWVAHEGTSDRVILSIDILKSEIE